MKFKMVQDNVDILKLCSLLGIEGDVRGANLTSKCPVNPDHDDKSPSFGIKIHGEGKGVWNCYGCGMKGNAVHLIMLMKGVERGEAESLLFQWFDLDDVIPEVSTKELMKMLEDTTPEDEEEVLVLPLPRLSGDKTPIINYLMSRRGYPKAEAEEIVCFYKMGYCDTGYYAGRIIIPIYDSAGVYVTFEAQRIDDGPGPKKLYPKGSQVSRLLFNDCNVRHRKVCACEGIWDAIRLRAYGYPAISVFGANNLSKYQAYKIIRKYDVVIIFFDGDKAGQKAVQRAVTDTFYPFVTTVAVSVAGKDPDEITMDEARDALSFYFD